MDYISEEATNNLSNNSNPFQDDFFTTPIVDISESILFPVEVFPLVFRTIICESKNSLNFPMDYTGTAILTAVSSTIGKSAKMMVKYGWFEFSAIYSAIIGNPGANKSHPIDLAFKPLMNLDKANSIVFEALYNEYQEYLDLSKKEKKEVSKPKTPKLLKSILHNFTPEILHHRLADNVRGCTIVSEELATFLEGMNNYSKGDQASVYLSFWSNKPTSIDRVSKPMPLFLQEPFLNIIGSLQPRVLSKLFPTNKSDNGFLQRFLFAFPNVSEKQAINDNEMDQNVVSDYSDWINNYHKDMPVSVNQETEYAEPKIYCWSAEAKAFFYEWHKSYSKSVNDNEGTLKSEIISKFDIHFVRIALILQIMDDYNTNEVALKAAQGADLLCKYYLNCAMKVLDVLEKTKQSDRLPDNKHKFYEALPSEFITGEAIKLGMSFDLSEKTVKRFIADKDLFKNVSHGKYSKIIF